MKNLISNQEKKLLKVGIYLRLSDEDKNKVSKEEDSESIKNQRNLLLEEINKRPNFILTDEYCDEDLSGAGTYRPEFERLIKDCEEKKIDIVLCKSQSRFSRDMEIIEKYLHNKFIEWNIRFISLTDNADTANTGNKKSRQINGLVNEWYLEDVSNNIRSAFNAKMKQGEFISPFAPFGYDISPTNNNKLIIDPIAAEIVKKIYTLYLKGLGLTGIAKYFNTKNIPSPSLYKYQKGIKLNIVSNRSREEIKWSTNTIKRILTNEVYLGHLIQGKRTTISYKNHKIKSKNKKDWIRSENTHEKIIEQETFEKVQKAIKERSKPIKKTGMVHNFSGKVFCLECGHTMRKKNSNDHEYLVCSNNRDGYNECPNQSSIRYDILETFILEKINKLNKKYFDENILKEIKEQEDKKYSNQINPQNIIKLLQNQKIELENKITQTKNYLKNLYEDKVNKIITENQFKDLITIYTKNQKNYTKKIKSLNQEIKTYKNEQKSKKETEFNKFEPFPKLNKIIIDEWIEKIYIGELNKPTNTRNIQINWNLK